MSVAEFGVLCQAAVAATAGLRMRRDSLTHDSQVFGYLIKYCYAHCTVLTHISLV
jgi:hypothetical protein